ncbi:MAG TPA: cation:proton antiporter [Jatrophihabitantaceae bacterium]|nr:cation:proton antiporter [Jatrophihabitantaceae bacterium]
MRRLFPIPLPALVLVAAAVASDLWSSLGDLSIQTDQKIVTIALAIILFHGGMHIGRARLRPILAGVVWLGTAGTLVTAAALAVAAHVWFDFGWHEALILGTALAPTDPAVVFAVLGKRRIPGRSGTLLEGESGANDPIGIALMITVLDAHDSDAGTVAAGAGHFLLQMGVGLVVGAVGGLLLLEAVRRVPTPDWLYPAQAVALALGLYWLAATAHGSGFLAVFVAGIAIGDDHKHRITHVTGRLSGLAEIVAFVVLGLSISLERIWSDGRVWTGLGIAAVLILLVRPVLCGLLLWPIRLSRGERVFVLWAGLKGAVPILLGTLAVTHGASGSARIYDVIFVVVTASVVVQGSLVPAVARLCGLTGRDERREP